MGLAERRPADAIDTNWTPQMSGHHSRSHRLSHRSQ
jgi:hypothetical protein